MHSERIGFRGLAVAVVLAVGVGLAGCGGGEPGRHQASSSDVIRLGALVPMTGDNAPSAESLVPALQMAAQEVNASGGVLGKRVEIVTADDACDPQTAVDGANAMVKDDITVSVGGYCSSATVPTLTIFHRAGIPMIIPAANSTDLIAPRYDSVFLLVGTTAIEAQRAVAWTPRLDAHKVVLVHDGTSFSETLASSYEATARKPGSQVSVVDKLRLSQGSYSYGSVAARIAAADGDIVFYTGYYAEAGKLIRDLRAAGYQGEIMLSDGGVNPAIFRGIDPAVFEGTYGVNAPMPEYQPGLKTWWEKYRTMAGHDPGPFTMQAYDSVRLAVNAIQRAGTVDRSAVRKALASTQPGDIHLLSGSAGFNPDGTCRSDRFILLRVHDGAFFEDSRSNR